MEKFTVTLGRFEFEAVAVAMVREYDDFDRLSRETKGDPARKAYLNEKRALLGEILTKMRASGGPMPGTYDYDR